MSGSRHIELLPLETAHLCRTHLVCHVLERPLVQCRPGIDGSCDDDGLVSGNIVAVEAEGREIAGWHPPHFPPNVQLCASSI